MGSIVVIIVDVVESVMSVFKLLVHGEIILLQLLDLILEAYLERLSLLDSESSSLIVIKLSSKQVGMALDFFPQSLDIIKISKFVKFAYHLEPGLHLFKSKVLLA